MRSALRPLIAPYTALALAMPLLSGCSGPSTAVPGDPSAEVGDEPAEVGDVETLQQNLLTLAIDEAFVWAPSPTPAPLPRCAYSQELPSHEL